MTRLLLMAAMVIPAFAQENKTITLSLSHPGFESKQAEEQKLMVRLDASGNPLGYSMDAKSVFCSDKKCDVITLGLEWSKLGTFIGYKLPQGTNLTKYEHKPFTKADYAKFDDLMKNRSSILAEIEIKQMIVKKKDAIKKTKQDNSENPGDVAGKSDTFQKVDAVSGATADYVKEVVVEGAAYTCYTMWHWAHGDTSQQIRIHAQNTGSSEWLGTLLKSQLIDEVDFALEAISRRQLHHTDLQKSAIANASNISMVGYQTLVAYLMAANPDPKTLYPALGKLLSQPGKKHRVYLLEQLLKQTNAPPDEFLETVASQVMDCERFYELHLLLSMLEKNNANSQRILTRVSHMLGHDNFFFSRRAHAFLKNRDLPKEAKTAFDAYEKRYAGRL